MAGNIVTSVHIADLLKAAHAGFIARKLATDKDLEDTILQALNYKGFALVEVIELCAGYTTKWNPMSKRDVQKILEGIDSGEMGAILDFVKDVVIASGKKAEPIIKALDMGFSIDA